MKYKFLGFLMFLILISGCKKDIEPTIRPVETFQATLIPKTLEYQYPGVVSPEKEANLSFRVAGPIDEFNVEIGSFVSEGTIIAKLDQRDYNLQLEAFKNKEAMAKNGYEAAKAISDNAKKQFARVEILYKEKAITKKKYDEALASYKAAISKEKAMLSQYDEAKKGVENCQNQLKDTYLIAPYDGYIHKKFADNGSIVGAGLPVVGISSLGETRVKINISENDIDKFLDIKEVFFIHNDKKYPLKLSEVSRVKSTLNLTYPVIFNFEENSDIPIDSQGIVSIIFDSTDETGIIIPAESIFEKNNEPNVWIYKDGVVNIKNIKIVKPYLNGMVIVKNINPGDKVVTKGVHELSENQKVNLLEPFSKTNVGNVL
ncbi:MULTISPECIES: efflux RND transporter periplasmic adaptor subunit [Fusobacterium]|uniref:efflux RND transporter periplasmic adaptor subunit n=1 Tax=Fusobacterium TaxID=848 RepID=UPI00147771B6|nr:MULTISPECIES: efflux RND transporter periplasmic adaptor subunit [Fusobacterium]NME35300.1 efflux RND transporter periplasmic adaptor subunit [Fusobacterium sp. FSA-380-WT-3A]